MKLWLNGTLQDEAAARIDPADRGFTLGDAVFETIRVTGGRPVFWPAHMARLESAAGFLGIALPSSVSALRAATDALLAANSLTDAAVRITLTRGPGPRGVLPPDAARPTLLITAAAMPARLAPARLIISRRTVRDESSPLSEIKSVNYLANIIACQEAAAEGADDAIILNRQGNLAETATSNIFLIIGDEIITPPVADGALPGIARAALLSAFAIRQASLTIANLAAAQAGCLSNSLSLRPVASICGRPLDHGHRYFAPMLDWFYQPHLTAIA
jgi:branched-chain amino acid aminotransferase